MSAYHGMTAWFAKQAERQSLLSCLKSMCPSDVGVREGGAPETDGVKSKLKLDIGGVLASHDDGMWADLKQTDQVWRAKLGRFPAGEVVAGESAIAANALLLQSLELLAGESASSESGKSGNDAKLATVLKGFPKLSAVDRANIISNRAKVAELEKKFFQTDDAMNAQNSMDLTVVRRALLSLWTKNKAALEKFRALNPKAFQSQFDFQLMVEASPAVQALQSGRDIDTAEASNLIYRVAKTDTWRRVHESPELSKQLGAVPRLDQFISARTFAVSVIPAKLDSDALSAHKKCRELTVDAAENAPTDDEIVRANVAIESARKNAIGFWSGRFSKQTSESAVERIKKTQVRLPPARKNFVAVLRQRLGADRDESEFATDVYGRFLEGQPRANLIAEGYSLDWYKHSMLASRAVACESSAAGDPAHTKSFAEISANAVQFSSRAIRDPGVTGATAAHEFNHIADPEYADQAGITISGHSRDLRSEVASCLKSQLGSDLDQGGYRSIEDFADLNLPTKSVHQITYCSIVKSPKGYFAKDSAFDKDHHSPAVFIVLHEAFRASGKLNDECRAYVSNYKPWKFRDCLEKPDAEKR
ncbi:hypothetical protein BH10BDE1_BH10BDE1_30640 [soil metagenome]